MTAYGYPLDIVCPLGMEPGIFLGLSFGEVCARLICVKMLIDLMIDFFSIQNRLVENLGSEKNGLRTVLMA